MKRIFLILALLAAVLLGGSWYVHRARIRALNSGDVFVREQPGGNPAPQPPPAAPPSQPAPPNPAGAASLGAANPSLPASAASAASAPASDTIARNPPNGMLVVGSGKYQLYRQGDITWRLNTDTGWACVLFATDSQWRKTRVYQNGCRAFSEASELRGY
jgi:hypothetical protein